MTTPPTQCKGCGAEGRREVELLLRCASTAPKVEAVRPLLEAEIDWQRLLEMAERHRVQPLLLHSLRRTHSAQVPAVVLDTLRERCFANTAKNLFLAGQLVRLLALLRARRIPVIAFKGPSLALMAYPDLSLRQIGDLDLLVQELDYVRVCHLLASQGMRCTADWGWESSFVDQAGLVCVDLHRTIAPPYFPIRFDFQCLYRRRVQLDGPGGAICTLAPEDMLIVACVQVAKDGHRQRCMLSKVCDIAELLHSQPDLDWVEIHRRSARLGCRRVLALGLHLARELLDTPCDTCSGVARVSPHVRVAADYVRNGIFRLTQNVPPDALADRRYYFAIRERWRDRVAPDVQRWRRMVLVPSEKDRAFLPFARAPEAVYYAVRPVRLARDYAIKALRVFSRWART